MKKNIHFVPLLLCIFQLLLLPITAKAGMEAFTYSYTDDAPLVDTANVFRSIYEEEKDIFIRGEHASWYFYYENIYRSTDRWRDFSTAVSIKQADNAQLTAALSGIPAYLIAFQDGDVYPGAAEVAIQVANAAAESKSFLLYTYDESADGAPVLSAIAERLSPDEEGCITITMTEAHDFLVIPTDTQPDALIPYLQQTAIQTGGLFGGAAIGWILFFAILGLLVLSLIIYQITVKLIRQKRIKSKS